jgi:hypothetical protein
MKTPWRRPCTRRTAPSMSFLLAVAGLTVDSGSAATSIAAVPWPMRSHIPLT